MVKHNKKVNGNNKKRMEGVHCLFEVITREICWLTSTLTEIYSLNII
jgi:hypothetical protein